MAGSESVFEKHRAKMNQRLEAAAKRAKRKDTKTKKAGSRREVGQADRLIRYMRKIGEAGDTQDGAQLALGFPNNHQSLSARWTELSSDTDVFVRIPELDENGVQRIDEKGRPVWKTKFTSKGERAVIYRLASGADGKPLTYDDYVNRRRVVLMRGTMRAICMQMHDTALQFRVDYANESTRESAVQQLITRTLEHATEIESSKKGWNPNGSSTP